MKINVKKTRSLRLGISEDEKVTLGNEKIDQVNSFTYLSSIISKDIGSSENVKSRIVKAQSVFSLKKGLEEFEDKPQINIRTLKTTLMTVTKQGFDA